MWQVVLIAKSFVLWDFSKDNIKRLTSDTASVRQDAIEIF